MICVYDIFLIVRPSKTFKRAKEGPDMTETKGLYTKLLSYSVEKPSERKSWMTTLLCICKYDVCRDKLSLNSTLAKQLAGYIEKTLPFYEKPESVDLAELYIHYFICLWYCMDYEGSAGYMQVAFRLIDQFYSVHPAMKLKARIYKIIKNLHVKKINEAIYLLSEFTSHEFTEFVKEIGWNEKSELTKELTTKVEVYKSEVTKPPNYNKFVSWIPVLQASATAASPAAASGGPAALTVSTASRFPLSSALVSAHATSFLSLLRGTDSQPERTGTQPEADTKADLKDPKDIKEVKKDPPQKDTIQKDPKPRKTEDTLYAVLREMGPKYEAHIKHFELLTLPDIQELFQQSQDNVLADLKNIGIQSLLERKLIYKKIKEFLSSSS
jgi:hypothetical protein